MISEGLTAAILETEWKSSFQLEARNDSNMRMRRALSWLGRAEQEVADPDAGFIFYWIAFNSIYADDSLQTYDLREAEKFQDYFTKAASLDTGKHIYNAIWTQHNQSIRALLDNQFVFKPFWTDAPSWRRRFEESKDSIKSEILNQDTAAILRRLFERLYVLRNQLLHGGATWNGSVNRSQVQDGAAIMAALVPNFIKLMLDNPNEDWGRPAYPADIETRRR